jgi:hypothetical protein
MVLTTEEKEFINKLSAITGIDSEQIKQVFHGLYICNIIYLYAKNSNYIYIPYFAKIKVETERFINKRQSLVRGKFDVIPTTIFQEDLNRIDRKQATSIETIIIKEISKHIDSLINPDFQM